MKRKVLLLLLITLNAQLVVSQNDKEDIYYLSSEINLRNYYGINANLN